MEYDFIIIGAGICGIQIGALCSTLGKVVILEKTKKVGGRARVINREGFILDWGPHPVRFGPRSALAKTLKDVGIKNIKFKHPGLMYAYCANGERHIFPSSIKGYIKTKMIPRFKTIKTILRLRKLAKKDQNNLYDMSFNEFYRINDIDPRIQRFLNMASTGMQVNPFPDRSSIGEFLKNFMEVIKKGSVYYPRGGWDIIFNSLITKIEENAGEIRTNAEVKEIIIEDGKAIGVKVGDEIIKSKYTISTIPVQQIFSILDSKYAPEDFVDKCEKLRQTAGIVIDFCLSKQITNENLMFFEDPPSFGIVPSNLSPDIVPQDKSIMSFFAPTDISIIKDKKLRDDYYDRFRANIIKTYPEIEDNIEYERKLFLEMVDGVEIAIDQYRGIRPMIEDITIPNLYLTGDSIGGTGAGGDIGHTSVRQCFKLIKKEM
ncbi:MAG: phytoene desaturase family protein [Candidatus Helarchaeota archaeon]